MFFGGKKKFKKKHLRWAGIEFGRNKVNSAKLSKEKIQLVKLLKGLSEGFWQFFSLTFFHENSMYLFINQRHV